MQFPSLIPFTTMVTRALAGRLVPTGAEYLDMFHDDAVFEFPYLPAGPVHVAGKADMARFLGSVEGGTDSASSCSIPADRWTTASWFSNITSMRTTGRPASPIRNAISAC